MAVKRTTWHLQACLRMRGYTSKANCEELGSGRGDDGQRLGGCGGLLRVGGDLLPLEPQEGSSIRNGRWQSNPLKCFCTWCLLCTPVHSSVPSTQYCVCNLSVVQSITPGNPLKVELAGREAPTPPAMTLVVGARFTRVLSQRLRTKARTTPTSHSIGHTEVFSLDMISDVRECGSADKFFVITRFA